ncbi:MAG: zinc metalloprotease HtpX [Prochlorothrix sp.]
MNQFKTVALLGLLSGLLVSLSYSLGGSGGALMGVAFAAIMNLGSWFYSDKIALAAYQAQPVSAQDAPQLYAMVAKLTDRAQMPMPQVYIIPSPAANAFATGRDPEHAAVAVTQGIMQMLPPEELEAVIAHELSHIYNRDTLTQAVAATVAGAISWLAQMAFWFMGSSRDDDGPNPLVALVGVLVAPLAATIIQLGISRTREFAADAGAARLTGNPRALANALRRLELGSQQLPLDANPAFAPLLIMGVPSRQMLANLFSTHPSTQDRIQRLLELDR